MTRPRFAGLGASLLAALPLLPLAANFRACDESRDWIARDYVDNLLATVAAGGLVLTQDWQVASPWLYVREIEQVRRDVVLLDINLMRRTWYLSQIERSFPAVAGQVAAELGAYREDLSAWERDPTLYQRNAALNRRIGTRFTALLRALAERHPAPVYITADLLYTPDATAREFAQALPTSYELVPQGLVFELASARGFRQPAWPRLSTRGLADGTVVLESDDVARLKVLPVYLTMLTNRGRYFEAYGRRAEAAVAYREALALDPKFAPARQALAEIQATLTR